MPTFVFIFILALHFAGAMAHANGGREDCV